MEVAQELAGKRAEENSRQLRSTESPSWQERAAWLLLCGVLVGVGLYILANYLRALAWALVLAIAIWPSFDRVRRQASPLVAKEVLPVLFTALVGLAVFLPFATLAVDALREVREIVDYGRTVEESGIPVPDFVIQLPYVGQWVADWWREHLSHAGWAKEIVQQMNTSSIRELGARQRPAECPSTCLESHGRQGSRYRRQGARQGRRLSFMRFASSAGAGLSMEQR